MSAQARLFHRFHYILLRRGLGVTALGDQLLLQPVVVGVTALVRMKALPFRHRRKWELTFGVRTGFNLHGQSLAECYVHVKSASH